MVPIEFDIDSILDRVSGYPLLERSGVVSFGSHSHNHTHRDIHTHAHHTCAHTQGSEGRLGQDRVGVLEELKSIWQCLD